MAKTARIGLPGYVRILAALLKRDGELAGMA